MVSLYEFWMNYDSHQFIAAYFRCCRMKVDYWWKQEIEAIKWDGELRASWALSDFGSVLSHLRFSLLLFEKISIKYSKFECQEWQRLMAAALKGIQMLVETFFFIKRILSWTIWKSFSRALVSCRFLQPLRTLESFRLIVLEVNLKNRTQVTVNNEAQSSKCTWKVEISSI